MSVEIRETKIVLDGASAIVSLLLSDGTAEQFGSIGLDVHVRLPLYKAALLGQMQREAILAAEKVLREIGQALLQGFPPQSSPRPE